MSIEQNTFHYRIQVSGQSWFYRTRREALAALPRLDRVRDAYLYQGGYSCDTDGATCRPMGKEHLLMVREVEA
jgi:hypothetical protein